MRSGRYAIRLSGFGILFVGIGIRGVLGALLVCRYRIGSVPGALDLDGDALPPVWGVIRVMRRALPFGAGASWPMREAIPSARSGVGCVLGAFGPSRHAMRWLLAVIRGGDHGRG